MKSVCKIYIPVKDKNGVPKDKVMIITEGGEIHKQILKQTGGKMPQHIIEDEN